MFGTHLSWITYRWFRTASVASNWPFFFYLRINIMRVFTWAYKKVVSFFCIYLVRKNCFITRHDFNATFSNHEQKRNGDKNQHQDKDWPVRWQLRAGGQRTGQVSLFVAWRSSGFFSSKQSLTKILIPSCVGWTLQQCLNRFRQIA